MAKEVIADNKDDMKTTNEELEAAVDADIKAAEEEAKAENAPVENAPAENAPVENAPVENAPVENVPVENAPVENAPVEDKITDEHLERAVKVGFTMAEARKFGSAELLESTVSRLEEAQKAKTNDGENDGEGEDPLANIPAPDPKDWDEDVIKADETLREIIRMQRKDISDLRKKEAPDTSADDWFDGKASGLTGAVEKAVKENPEKLKAIRGKFDVLAAGYKAAGQDVSRGDAFEEAVSITMGDVIAKAANDKKAKDLAARAKQHTRRAPGNGGGGSVADVDAEIAKELDRAYPS